MEVSMASTDEGSATSGEMAELGTIDMAGSYLTTASFSDPDGNGWLLQEITTRLPGREWED